MISAILGALTRYLHSDLSLYTRIGVALDNFNPIKSDQDRPCDFVVIDSLILRLDIIKPFM